MSCSDLRIFYGRQQMGRDTRGNRAPSAMIIHHTIRRAPGWTYQGERAAHHGSSLMSWGVLRPWFVVCSEQKIYGRPATNGTGHQEETGIIDNDHPSINNEGNGMDVPGRTSCSLWFFFDVMGSIAPPGLWSAQIYESSTAGNGWDGTPGETGHHRQ